MLREKAIVQRKGKARFVREIACVNEHLNYYYHSELGLNCDPSARSKVTIHFLNQVAFGSSSARKCSGDMNCTKDEPADGTVLMASSLNVLCRISSKNLNTWKGEKKAALRQPCWNRHRGNTYLTSVPLVSVRQLSESRDKLFHLECKLRFPWAQIMLRRMHLTKLSVSNEVRYWVSWL